MWVKTESRSIPLEEGDWDNRDLERDADDPRDNVLPQGLLCVDWDRLPLLRDSVRV